MVAGLKMHASSANATIVGALRRVGGLHIDGECVSRMLLLPMADEAAVDCLKQAVLWN